MPRRGARKRAPVEPSDRPDVADYVEAEVELDYRHSVALQRAPRPGAGEVEVVPTRRGADMPEILELATWLYRDQMRALWESAQARGGHLEPEDAARFNAMQDPLTKLSREVRQWRAVEDGELAGLSDDEMREAVSAAVEHLGGETVTKLLGIPADALGAMADDEGE